MIKQILMVKHFIIKYFMMKQIFLMKQIFFSFFLVLVLGAFTLSYQNCARTDLESVVKPLRIVSSPVDLQSSICADTRTSAGTNTKFVFIMDLSASNMGDWRVETINGDEFYYWDPTKGFDPNKARFTAIENFLDNCANQNGEQFAVIGFSSHAGILEANEKTLNCKNIHFAKSATVKEHLRVLKDRQTQDEQWYKRWTQNYLIEKEPDSLIYNVTSYTEASKCLESVILRDLESKGNSSDHYSVFFISDGTPQDKFNTGCRLPQHSKDQEERCYMESSQTHITMARTAALAKGRNLTIQGIYYGDPTINPTVLNAISIEGGTGGVKYLDGFEKNQGALCDLIVSQHAHEYKPDLYAVINLNVSRVRGELSVDSDGDGLPDHLEVALGYDPTHPRSSEAEGILDGICERLGGKVQCQKQREALSCDPQKFDSLGLTDCDQKILKLHLAKLSLVGGGLGVDTDGDGLPDYVEILKGTNPALADQLFDPDRDGVLNRDEILSGTDPFFPDKNLFPLDQLNHYELKYHLNKTPLCQYGEWKMTLGALQHAPTLAVQGWPSSHSFHNKKEKEQTLLFLYRLAPMNSLSPYEYYYHFVKVTPTKENELNSPLSSSSKSVNPQDFLRLGFGL
jgi:hypothetical protein